MPTCCRCDSTVIMAHYGMLLPSSPRSPSAAGERGDDDPNPLSHEEVCGAILCLSVQDRLGPVERQTATSALLCTNGELACFSTQGLEKYRCW